MLDLTPLQFGLPGGPELLIILLIAVLLFGANKIPKLARSTGEAMGEFQKGREEVEEELQEMREGPSQEGSEDVERIESAEASEEESEEFEVADAESETEPETEEETN